MTAPRPFSAGGRVVAGQEDIDYFRERAQTERGRAVESANPQVAARHLELAAGYDVLVERAVREQGMVVGARTSDNVVPIRSDPVGSLQDPPETRIIEAG